MTPDPWITSDVIFRLAPCLNAAGRLGDAQVALDLLLASDAAEASRLAGELDDMNRHRQRIQEEMWAEALRAAEAFPNDAASVLGAEGWHQGVVGIVAAKLVDKFKKPVVVVGFKDYSGRGSARTTGGLDLYQSLAACQEHLTVFGGHAAAAGLGLSAAQMEAFRAKFVAQAQSHFDSRTHDPVLEVDAAAELADLIWCRPRSLNGWRHLAWATTSHCWFCPTWWRARPAWWVGRTCRSHCRVARP